MNGPSSDRNLLLGIVALQMDFVARDDLIKAMHDWTLDKTRSLSEILVENGALDPADRAALESLVDRHIARHDGDVDRSLSSIDIIVHSRTVLESIDDPDLNQSLGKLMNRPIPT
jgi:eukaryotic-like serine/threonine-protein kinase